MILHPKGDCPRWFLVGFTYGGEIAGSYDDTWAEPWSWNPDEEKREMS